MPRILKKCSVINCDSVNTDDSERRIPMWKFPDADSVDFMTWLNAASPYLLLDNNRKRRIHICSLHFTEECFEQNEIRILKDGEEIVKPRSVPRLKKGAYPTIFPSGPMPEKRETIKEAAKPKEPYCVVENCPGKDSEEIKLFGIPGKDVKAWCQNLMIQRSTLNICSRVCSRHFEESDIGWERVRRGARPTLNLGHNNLIVPSNVSNVAFKFQQRVCVILNCPSKNPPDLLFPFPNDAHRRNIWLKNCNFKAGMKVLKNKWICEKHFHSSMLTNVNGKVRLLGNATPRMKANKAAVKNAENCQKPNTENKQLSCENEDENIQNLVAANNQVYFEIQELEMPISEVIPVKNEPMSCELESDSCGMPLVKLESAVEMNEFIKIEPMDEENNFTALPNTSSATSCLSTATAALQPTTSAVACGSCAKLLEENQFRIKRCITLEKELKAIRSKYDELKAGIARDLTALMAKNRDLKKHNAHLMDELYALKK